MGPPRAGQRVPGPRTPGPARPTGSEQPRGLEAAPAPPGPTALKAGGRPLARVPARCSPWARRAPPRRARSPLPRAPARAPPAGGGGGGDAQPHSQPRRRGGGRTGSGRAGLRPRRFKKKIQSPENFIRSFLPHSIFRKAVLIDWCRRAGRTGSGGAGLRSRRFFFKKKSQNSENFIRRPSCDSGFPETVH